MLIYNIKLSCEALLQGMACENSLATEQVARATATQHGCRLIPAVNLDDQNPRAALLQSMCSISECDPRTRTRLRFLNRPATEPAALHVRPWSRLLTQ